MRSGSTPGAEHAHAAGAIKENSLEENSFVAKEHAVEEGIVEAKSHPLEFSLQFREEVLRIATPVEIPQDVFLRVAKTILGTSTVLLLIPNTPKLIILSAFLGITQDTVGFTDALEAFLSSLIVGVPVRMGLEREFAVGLLDFFRGGLGCNSQGLVVIVMQTFLPVSF